MLKKTILFAAVAGLVISATPTMGATVRWDGGGDGVNWSDWSSVDTTNVDNFGNWDGDPTAAGVTELLLSGGSSTANVDMTTWPNTPFGQINVYGHTLTVPSGGVLTQNGMYFRVHSGSTLRFDGGGLGPNCYDYLNLNLGGAGTVEFLGGTFSPGTGTHPYLHVPGHVHVIGKTAGSDFNPWFLRSPNPAQASFQFTLEAGEGVDKMRLPNTDPLAGPSAGTFPLTVDGIKAYLDGGGLQMDWDLITAENVAPDQEGDLLLFQSGPVDGGLGIVYVSKDRVWLHIPEPASAVLLLIGAPLLALRRRRRS